MTENTRTLTYRGPPAALSMLAQMLEEEGCKVQWEQPREERDASGMVEAVVTQLVASGLLAGIQAAITRFRERTKGRAEVTDGDDDD